MIYYFPSNPKKHNYIPKKILLRKEVLKFRRMGKRKKKIGLKILKTKQLECIHSLKER